MQREELADFATLKNPTKGRLPSQGSLGLMLSEPDLAGRKRPKKMTAMYAKPLHRELMRE
jgi:hypothetical protein